MEAEFIHINDNIVYLHELSKVVHLKVDIFSKDSNTLIRSELLCGTKKTDTITEAFYGEDVEINCPICKDVFDILKNED